MRLPLLRSDRVFSRSDVLVRHRRSHIKEESDDSAGLSSSKRHRSSTTSDISPSATVVETASGTTSLADPSIAAVDADEQGRGVGRSGIETALRGHGQGHTHHRYDVIPEYGNRSGHGQMNVPPTQDHRREHNVDHRPAPSHRHVSSIHELLSPSSYTPRPVVPPPPPNMAPPPPMHRPMSFDGGGPWQPQQQQQQPMESPHYSEPAPPHFPSPDLFAQMSGTNDPSANTQQASTFDLFAGGWSSNTLTGLDWIFDDQCDSASSTDASVMSRLMNGAYGLEDNRMGDWQVFGPSPPVDRIGEMLGTSGRGHGTTTESLNLLNLANAAAVSARTGETAAQPHKPRSEEDTADAWPQEFRPQRSKPSIIEISDYSLDIEEQHQANDLEAWLAAATATPQRGTPNGASGGGDRPIVVIDEAGDATRANSRRASESPNGSGLFGCTPPRWRVSEETRLQLLQYLQQSCRHPWSIYSFSKTPPPTFLTCGQLELLVSLFFRKFNPYCPVLHPPTFDPATAPPVQLLITLTVGLVFYASEVQAHVGVRQDRKDALAQLRKSASVLALAFSELARIGVMSGYEADQTAWQNVELNQTWTVQQMFGIGSGDNRLLKLAERNRGGLITAIRRSGFFHTTDLRIDGNALVEMTPAQLDRTWKSWIDAEKRVRLGWFVFLYDQLFACFNDISPMLLYTEISSPFPCEERLWNAGDAAEWARRYRFARANSTSGSSSTPPEVGGQMPFLLTLRQLLFPNQRPQAAPQLRVNRLEAYILSVTLYRICWDAQRQSILFETDNGLEVDTACVDKRLDTAASRALKYLADSASRATSVVKSRAPPPSSSDSQLSLALSIDVQLLSLLQKIHFLGPPAFFQKLRDAAGRSGWHTPRRTEALAWLETWMARLSNRAAMKSMLVASAQVFDLIRSSLNSTVAKPDVLVVQSNICVISLFHASLYVWAYVKLSHSKRSAGNGVDPPLASRLPPVAELPHLSPTKIAHVESTGYIDLVLNPYEALNSAEGLDFSEPWEHHMTWEGDHEKLVQAWLHGAYVCERDGQVKEWAGAHGLTPRIVGIGELLPSSLRGAGGESSGSGSGSLGGVAGSATSISSSPAALLAAAGRSVKASHVLQRFASLIRRLDWGLANTLSAILLLMARREAKAEMPGKGVGA